MRSSSASLGSALRGEGPALALAQLEANLSKSGSTWIRDPGGLNLDHVPEAISAHCGVDRYWSSERIGGAEKKLASWVRAAIEKPCATLTIRSAGLTEDQRDAGLLCLSNRVVILSGLPGTGKTYTARAIAGSASEQKLSVMGAALTGIAASRLSESIGIPCSTIHRLLGYDGKAYRAKSIDCDMLLLDECSMLPPHLLLSVVSRIRAGCRLILIGDPNQLPSVEPGEVLRDLCDSGVVAHAYLSEVLRTEEDSPIGHAAQRILDGHIPVPEQAPSGRGGVWIAKCDSLALRKEVKRPRNHPLTIAEHCADLDETPLSSVRTMAYSNDRVETLCSQWQWRRKSSTWPVPVLCVRNRHDLGVYNGDFGIVDPPHCQIFNGRIVRLRPSEYVYGWASTVHKMQGSEALSCQISLEPTMSRRLLYTAATRAKRRLIFTGDPAYLQRAVEQTNGERFTLLRHLLTEDTQ